MRNLYRLDDLADTKHLFDSQEYKAHINSSMYRLLGLINRNVEFVKAEGMFLFDDRAQRYLDFFGCAGSLNLGHNNPEIVRLLVGDCSYPNFSPLSVNRFSSALAHNLSVLTDNRLEVSFLCNSGTEAVEGALKLAIAASHKRRIIYCDGAFHGKTLGSLSVTGKKRYQEPFLPLLPMCESVPYNDLGSLEQKIGNKDVAAFIVEPIQGENGIIIPDAGYLRGVRALCDRYGVLLIVDEVQTGMGRTGKMFAFNHEKIYPDIVCLAKSLGGGVMPIGAYIAKRSVWKKAYGSVTKCFNHSSTFGGNTMACKAALKTIELLMKDNQLILKECENKGNYFLDRLKELKRKHHCITDVRGKGLMMGIEFGSRGRFMKKVNDNLMVYKVIKMLFKDYKIVTCFTLNRSNVIRVEPPLVITYEDIDYFINSLDQVCNKI